ncbi:hypothetical protein G3545_08720 [Starkeya sp. ORNL1]|uniref:DUF6572 domain-containing protein n=1 Tax=Starkeya sp. ORNL1 TaxID=2709380 RepID=UPI0014631982|nr:DUF6572 domain-containing protein [Starkeya sp. ORNL1]QJP13733.1 hypothetical protein G3545_08720 [Starkeya sp. ORNL1]
MSVDDLQVIDAVATDAHDGTIMLVIFDGWDWSDEWEHLNVLQDKINAYLGFVESGQIYEEYPAAVGRKLRIDIFAMLPMPDIGIRFLEQVAAVALQLDIIIAHRVTPMPE